jgi:plastocyanin
VTPTTAGSASPEVSAAPTLSTSFVEDRRAPAGAIEVLLTFGPTFEPEEATARPGTVVFFLKNDKGDGPPALHNFLLGTSVDAPALATSPTLASGFAGTFTVEGLEPGTYTYWCTVLGPDGRTHSQMGMTGTLTVTP